MSDQLDLLTRNRRADCAGILGIHFQKWEVICLEFEKEIRLSGRPNIADYVERWKQPEHRDLLIEELLQLDFAGKPDPKSLSVSLLAPLYPEISAESIARALQRFTARINNASLLNLNDSELTTLRTAAHIPESSAVNSPAKDTIADAGEDSRPSDGRQIPKPTDKQAQPGLGRFRIIREHAQGGLGVVYLAEDRELGREVALKQIRQDCAFDSVYREKFTREATVTGQLEHPSIVPVYALGFDDIGRPFYAMRFVKGQTLQAKIAEFHALVKEGKAPFDGMQLRQLLRRFINVCEAMAYAHHRGIVHRDLKPSNVMLGKYGETLVVDWGLARPFESKSATAITPSTSMKSEMPLNNAGSDSDSQTRIGSFRGTLAYAPPEQLRGDIDDLGPTSDIYSIGAMLFELLTGEPIVKSTDSVRQLADDILLGRLPKPRSINSAIPKSLESICLRAMAGRIKDRYPSATSLQKDIEAFLDDEVVSAHKENYLSGFRRYLRKHQSVASSVAGFMIAAVVATSIIIFVLAKTSSDVARANLELADGNSQLEKKAAELAAANNEKQKFIDEKTRTEKIAKEQTLLAFEALTDVIKPAAPVSGQAGERGLQQQKKLADVLSKLSRLERGYVEEAALHEAIVRGMVRLAKAVTELGKVDELAKSVLDLKPIVLKSNESEAQNSSRRQNDSQSARTNAGDSDASTIDSSIAEILNRTFKLASDLAERDPKNSNSQHTLLEVYPLLVSAQRKIESAPEVDRITGEYLEKAKSLASLFPSDTVIWQHQIRATLARGKSEFAIENTSSALSLLREAVALTDPTSNKTHPSEATEDMEFSLLRVASLFELANALEDSKADINEAAQRYQETLSTIESLASNPKSQGNADLIKWKAMAATNLAYLYWNQGKTETAVGLSETALASRRELQSLTEDSVDLRSSFAWALINHADILADLGARDQAAVGKAQSLYLEAVELLSRPMPQKPSRELARDLSTAYERVGMLLMDNGKNDESRTWFEKMLAGKQKLADEDPNDLLAQRELAITYMHFGDLALKLNQTKEAIEAYAKQLDIARRTSARAPNSARYLVDLSTACANYASVMGNNLLTKEELYRLGLASIESASSKSPENRSIVRRKAFFEFQLANTQTSIKALAPLEDILSSGDEVTPDLLSRHATSLHGLDSLPEFEPTAERLIETGRGDCETVFEAAAVYAMGAEEANRLLSSSFDLGDERQKQISELRERLKTKAFENLQTAIQLGYFEMTIFRTRTELEILRSDPRWKEIDFESATTRDAALSLLKFNAELKVFVPNDPFPKAIASPEELPPAVSSVESVNTKGRGDLKRSVLSRLKDLRGLKVAFIEHLPIEEIDLESLAQCRTLRTIALGAVEELGEEDFRKLAPLPNLEELFLGDTRLTDVNAAQLESLKRLNLLDCKNSQITDAGLVHIGRITSLYDLCLNGNQITDDGIRNISNLDLYILRLNSTRITNQAIPLIAKMKSLQTLDLAETSIDDSGLVQLSELQNLGKLDLRNTQVTASGIRQLLSKKQLREIRVNGLSADEYANLTKSFPFTSFSSPELED